MDLSGTPLDQVGASAHAHYKAAEKAAGKAEEHYKSAGIYLKSAKLRVLKTKGLTWERWLRDHCPISRSRADEVIAISDGRMDPGYHTQAAREERQEKKSDPLKTKENSGQSAGQPADRPEKPNENNEGPSQPSASEQSSPKPEHKPEPETDPVKEAEDINAKAHAQRIRVLKSRLDKATEDQLQQIEGIFNV